jgi:hypothetical protein
MRTKVCQYCGSDNIVFDAWARWDPIKEEFVLGQVFEQVFCNDCGAETADIDKEVP